MSDKPEVRLENWYLIGGTLYGNAFGHPRFDDNTLVRTSSVISEPPEDRPSQEGDRLETRNTFYTLGKPGKRDERNR